MAIVKALRRLAGGSFGLIAATDQIACDAGAMTVTETGAGASSSLPNLFKAKANASDLLGIASDTAGLFSDLSEGAGLDLRMSRTTVASQATVDLGAIATVRAAITGTAAISSFGAQPNVARHITFTNACTLVHNATSLVLPTAANIVTQPGDTAWAFSDVSGNWIVGPYQRADGSPVFVPGAPISIAVGASSQSGSLGSANGTLQYQKINSKLCWVALNLTVQNNGTGSGAVIVSLPFAAGIDQTITGRENGLTGFALQGYIPAGGNNVIIRFFNNNYPAGNGAILILTGTYWIQ